ncbi:hypothetical protein V6259_12940 [Marinomonas sp. TI.3.20]|uniref:hypothetical protein n=1 Tax=Marinomonas sp. TI.3.20 TaxID=3121296 RepID=UPI00311E1BDB
MTNQNNPMDIKPGSTLKTAKKLKVASLVLLVISVLFKYAGIHLIKQAEHSTQYHLTLNLSIGIFALGVFLGILAASMYVKNGYMKRKRK